MEHHLVEGVGNQPVMVRRLQAFTQDFFRRVHNFVGHHGPHFLHHRPSLIFSSHPRLGYNLLGLTLCVYQIEDPSSFQALSASAEGLDQLLDCKLEPAKARASRSFLIQPGKNLDIVQDRVEKARYFAVVAGYDHLEPDLCSAIIPFPIHTEKVGIIFRDTVYTAAPMQALIHLGAESVTISGVERVQ